MNLPLPVLMPDRPKAEAATRSLTVEVFFDFVCPWCLIGKRQLDAAARRLVEVRPDVHLQVVWRSHPLLPGTPIDGLPYQAFYAARLGSPEAVSRRRAQVQRAGADAGVRFDFDRIQLLPNTARAHAWVERAGQDRQAALVDRIFTAYFLEGQDIGDRSVLERLALECGLQEGAPGGTGAGAGEARLPVPGVPFFVVDGSVALSGATPSDTMLKVMLRALDAQLARPARG